VSHSLRKTPDEFTKRRLLDLDPANTIKRLTAFCWNPSAATSHSQGNVSIHSKEAPKAYLRASVSQSSEDRPFGDAGMADTCLVAKGDKVGKNPRNSTKPIKTVAGVRSAIGSCVQACLAFRS